MRETHTAKVLEGLARAGGGEATVVVLRGISGSGKSSYVQGILDKIPGAVVCSADRSCAPPPCAVFPVWLVLKVDGFVPRTQHVNLTMVRQLLRSAE
ncbi:hypothetical protein T484DRAFT_2502321 [Baffinella frigidus]|nr:hypothetical protein T484DRAFT_2502321 [Cryptophyta sp. CCMP2293]